MKYIAAGLCVCATAVISPCFRTQKNNVIQEQLQEYYENIPAKEIHTAIRNNDYETLTRQITSCPSNKEAAYCGNRPLHTAAESGNLAIIAFLVSWGASYTHQRPLDGNTPAHIAAKYLYTPIVTTLQQYGANLDTQDHNGLSPRDIMYRTWGIEI